MNWRRADLKALRDDITKQVLESVQKNLGLQCIKCRVTGQFLPGESSPFTDDFNIDPQMWQVTLIPEDSHAQSYASSLADKSFNVRGDPEVLMQTYGSEGMLDKVVNLWFSSLNIRTTGEVSILESVAGFGLNDGINTVDTVTAKSIDLSLASLLP